MNRIYLMLHENDDEEIGYLIFSCVDEATDFLLKSEIEPYAVDLVSMAIDDPGDIPNHRYDWDGLSLNYVRL